jgi:hypothetical protein
VGALTRALVPAGADEVIDIGLHDDPQHAPDNAAQGIAVAGG